MKKFGLIGGVGPESTIQYYRLIIKKFQEKLETKDYPEIVISSINMTKMLDYIYNNQFDELVGFLSKKLELLELMDIDFAAIASNTPHIVFNQLKENVKLPLVSIVEETIKKIKASKLQRVGLIGTKSTMSSGFYSNVAKNHGIKIITPSTIQQDYIHSIYMNELVFNIILWDTKKHLIQIINEIKEKESIEGLILGGTELPLIINQSDFYDLEIFDTTVIHVESIVNRIIDNYE